MRGLRRGSAIQRWSGEPRTRPPTTARSPDANPPHPAPPRALDPCSSGAVGDMGGAHATERRPGVDRHVCVATTWAATGTVGRRRPSIDRFALEGVVFDSHVSSTSWTLPAHAGALHRRAGLRARLRRGDGKGARAGVRDPGGVLRPERATARRDSTRGRILHEAFGLGQGFEEYRYCVVDDDTFDAEHRKDEWADDPGQSHHRSHEGVTNERVYDAAREWLEENKGRVLLLLLALLGRALRLHATAAVGHEVRPRLRRTRRRPELLLRYESIAPGMAEARPADHLIALYDGEIGWTDTFLGKLRADLEAWGLAENTVVAITSDHGTEFFEHGGKGHRRTLYDEVIRVPLVLWYPARPRARPRPRADALDRRRRHPARDRRRLRARRDDGAQPRRAREAAGHLDFDNAAVSELYSVGSRLRSVRTVEDKLIHDENQPADPARWFDLSERPARTPAPRGHGHGARTRGVHMRFLRQIVELRSRRQSRRPGDPCSLRSSPRTSSTRLKKTRLRRRGGRVGQTSGWSGCACRAIGLHDRIGEP